MVKAGLIKWGVASVSSYMVPEVVLEKLEPMCSTRPAYRRASPSRVVRTYVGASYTSLCTFELCTLSNTMATIGTPPHAQLVYML